MSMYNIFLFLLEHYNNRMFCQWMDKVALNTTGMSLMEKFNLISW